MEDYKAQTKRRLRGDLTSPMANSFLTGSMILLMADRIGERSYVESGIAGLTALIGSLNTI